MAEGPVAELLWRLKTVRVVDARPPARVLVAEEAEARFRDGFGIPLLASTRKDSLPRTPCGGILMLLLGRLLEGLGV